MKKRNTVQRFLVLNAVRELQCHATVDEIYNVIIKNHPNISKGTVYRNLSYLTDIGEINKLEVPNESDRYDHLCYKHYHARCIKCYRIFDVEMDVITDLEKKIKDTHGFKFVDHDIFFKGICPECSE